MTLLLAGLRDLYDEIENTRHRMSFFGMMQTYVDMYCHELGK